VLRKIFGSKTDEVTGECSKRQNEELNNLYSSPNITRVIKSRRKKWVGHVAGMGERTGVYRVLGGNVKLDLQEVGLGEWNVLMWFRIGAGDEHL
jgi:hypothetical protein